MDIYREREREKEREKKREREREKERDVREKQSVVIEERNGLYSINNR